MLVEKKRGLHEKYTVADPTLFNFLGLAGKIDKSVLLWSLDDCLSSALN